MATSATTGTGCREQDCIDYIYASFRHRISPAPGLCDAESLTCQAAQLINIDEISAFDALPEDSPFDLGWNVAAIAISDILAAGGRPRYLAHSLTVSKSWTRSYFEQFVDGLAEFFNACGICLTSGDFSAADRWSYTACVIGEPLGRGLTRVGAEVGDSLYVTGAVGQGNLLACRGDERHAGLHVSPRFAPPIDLVPLISRYASCCIDTSDGLVKALHGLLSANGLGAEVVDIPYERCDAFPYAQVVLALASAGEYQLLFAVPRTQSEALECEIDAGNLPVRRLGVVDDTRAIRLREGPAKFQVDTTRLANVQLDGRDIDGYANQLLGCLLPLA